MPDLGDIVVHFQRVHIFALAIGIIALLNLFTIRRSTPKLLSREKPLVSVLVPARNEEHNIQKCLRSLFAQDYPRLEILVWDDCSTDRTREPHHLQGGWEKAGPVTILPKKPGVKSSFLPMPIPGMNLLP